MLAQFDWNKKKISLPWWYYDVAIYIGFSSGMTTGTPIHVIVPNTDQVGGVSIYVSGQLY